MPADYSIDGDLVRVELTGRTEADEVVATLQSACEKLSITPFPALLIDVRASSSVPERSSDEMRAAVRMVSEYSRLFDRRAVVATAGVRFGMMRMAVSLAEPSDEGAQVFVDEREALLWLLRRSDGSDQPTGMI